MKSLRKGAFFLVVVLQLFILLGMIAKRIHLLHTGTVVRLDCRPVDPRSLLSGDYVELRYRIADLNSLPGTNVHRRREDRFSRTIYVALEKGTDDDVWHAVACSDAPQDVAGAERVVVRGRTDSGLTDIRYGIEQFFVPQYQGLRIERNLDRVTVDVAVGSSGECAIKRLYIDGTEVNFH